MGGQALLLEGPGRLELQLLAPFDRIEDYSRDAQSSLNSASTRCAIFRGCWRWRAGAECGMFDGDGDGDGVVGCCSSLR